MRIICGTVYRRGKLWTINYTVNGKRIREAIRTDRELAKHVLRKRTTAAIEGREFDKRPQVKAVTFRELAEVYLTRHVCTLKSARRERDRVNAWVGRLGTRTLDSITAAELLDWRAGKLVNCKPATVNRDMMRLKSTFSRACEWGMLNARPARGIRPLRENNQRERYLTPAECASLIRACTAEESTRECPGSLVKPVVTVALHTGMRLGEILNLRWQDVDWEREQLGVRDSKNGEEGIVPADETVLELLRARATRTGTGRSASQPAG